MYPDPSSDPEIEEYLDGYETRRERILREQGAQQQQQQQQQMLAGCREDLLNMGIPGEVHPRVFAELAAAGQNHQAFEVLQQHVRQATAVGTLNGLQAAKDRGLLQPPQVTFDGTPGGDRQPRAVIYTNESPEPSSYAPPENPRECFSASIWKSEQQRRNHLGV